MQGEVSLQGKGRPHFPLVDSMRGLMALWVFVTHAAFYLGIGMHLGLVAYLVEHVSNYPGPAVVVFFTISGFVLYRPFTQARFENRPRANLVSYGIRRIARIGPAYWLALIVAGIVLYPRDVFVFPRALFFWGWAQIYDSNVQMHALAQTWTVDVELVFYAALPLLVIGMRRWRVSSRRAYLASELGLCGLLFLASFIWQVIAIRSVSVHSQYFWGAVLSFPASLDMFACGMALAVLSVAYEDRPPGRLRRLAGRAPWVPLAIAMGAFYMTGELPSLISPQRHLALLWMVTKEFRCLLGVAVMIPLIFGWRERGMFRAALASKPVRFLGVTCYGFYLWHGPILAEMWRLGGREKFGAGGYVALSLALSVAFGAASWYLIELPTQLSTRRWTAKHLSPAGVRAPGREPELPVVAPPP